MKSALSILGLLLFVWTQTGFSAPTHNVTVRVDNDVYVCNGGGTGTDPNCIKEITDYCYSKTGMSSSDCYTKATQGCKGAPSNFSDCVKSTTDYCYSKTGMSSSDCFNKAVGTCAGNVESIKQMIDGAKASAK